MLCTMSYTAAMLRRRPSLLPGHLGRLAVHRGDRDGGRRSARPSISGSAPAASAGCPVRARPARRRGQPARAVGRRPAAQRRCPERHNSPATRTSGQPSSRWARSGLPPAGKCLFLGCAGVGPDTAPHVIGSAICGKRRIRSVSLLGSARVIKGPFGKKCLIRPAGPRALGPVAASAGGADLGVGHLVVQQGIQLGGFGAGVAEAAAYGFDGHSRVETRWHGRGGAE